MCGVDMALLIEKKQFPFQEILEAEADRGRGCELISEMHRLLVSRYGMSRTVPLPGNNSLDKKFCQGMLRRTIICRALGAKGGSAWTKGPHYCGVVRALLPADDLELLRVPENHI